MADKPIADQSADTFQDPLENFEPKEYADELEKALAEETVASIQHHPFKAVPPTTPVREALKTLAELHVACLLVTEGDKLVGVFSDRDALKNVALEGPAIMDQPISAVMTNQPIYVYSTDSVAAALSVMAVSGYRHVPVVDLDDKVIGIVSPQRVTEFLKKFF